MSINADGSIHEARFERSRFEFCAGQLLGQWSLNWIVLPRESAHLLVYKQRVQLQPPKTIRLTAAKLQILSGKQAAGKSFAFAVHSSDRSLILAADDADDRDAWIQALHAAGAGRPSFLPTPTGCLTPVSLRL